MADRGYEELTDLRPNAGVRADGTRPARAGADQPRGGAAPRRTTAWRRRAAAAAAGEPEPPSVVAQKPPEILSKSLLGQRSDDEAASWEKTKARDFDWDR